jgi:hypothetical protein
LILIFIEFIRILLYFFEIFGQKVKEITHVRLVDPLPGRGMDNGVGNGKPKFYYWEESKG